MYSSGSVSASRPLGLIALWGASPRSIPSKPGFQLPHASSAVVPSMPSPKYSSVECWK
jgi:hypothetical protein